MYCDCYCEHVYHGVISAVFERLAKRHGQAVFMITDRCFLEGEEGLLEELYNEIDREAPDKCGEVYCCASCGCYDLALGNAFY